MKVVGSWGRRMLSANIPNIFFMVSSKRVRVKLLSLPGYGEKQQLKNIPMRMNSQEEICLPVCPISPAKIDDFHLKYSILKGNAKT